MDTLKIMFLIAKLAKRINESDIEPKIKETLIILVKLISNEIKEDNG